jgi:arabinose-5-phosphate isomerase
VVVNADGRLAGIFTHGDFARHFQNETSGTDLGAQPVGAHMTPRPITIRGDRLAAEILQLLDHARIDDLVVVDADDRPIGLVDTQDLTRLKLV